MKTLTADRSILLILLLLVIIRGIIYLTVVPPWLAPDEATHFEAIRLIGQEGLWPTEDVYQSTPMHPQMHASFEKYRVWQLSGLPSPRGQRTPGDPTSDPYVAYYPAHKGGSAVVAGNYPLLYHILLSPLATWLKSASIDRQLYLFRLTSLFLTTLTVMAGWFFARTLVPYTITYAVAVASFLIFLPMHLHINTSVNTDVLATVLTSFYFLALAKLFCGSPGAGWKAGLLLFFVAALLVKPTTLFIAPTSAAAAIIYIARRRRWPGVWLAAILIGLVAAVAVGSIPFYQWSAGGRGVATLSFAIGVVDWPFIYVSRQTLLTFVDTVRWTFLSFWGLFGWTSIPISNGWTRFWWGLTLLVGSGLGLFYFKYIFSRSKRQTLTASQQDFLVVLLLAVSFALIGAFTPTIATQFTWWGPQSRYLFPALLPISLLFFIGFQQLFPARFNRFALPLYLTLFVVFDSAVLFGRLIPFIYG